LIKLSALNQVCFEIAMRHVSRHPSNSDFDVLTL